MAKSNNILESVEFLAEEDLLVAELDKRLSFTAMGAVKHDSICPGKSVCDCLIHVTCTCIEKKFETPPTCNYASAVRG